MNTVSYLVSTVSKVRYVIVGGVCCCLRLSRSPEEQERVHALYLTPLHLSFTASLSSQALRARHKEIYLRPGVTFILFCSI